MSTAALARDPLPFEGVAGRPVDLCWDLTDETGSPDNLDGVTQVEVSIRKRVPPGEVQPATMRLLMSDGAVERDAEIGQILCPLGATQTVDLGAGQFDVQLDLTVAGEAEPTTWRGLLTLLEDL